MSVNSWIKTHWKTNYKKWLKRYWQTTKNDYNKRELQKVICSSIIKGRWKKTMLKGDENMSNKEFNSYLEMLIILTEKAQSKEEIIKDIKRIQEKLNE